MFTGIITEIGKVKNIERKSSGLSITVTCGDIASEAALGDSVAVNGACLSVIKKGNGLTFDAVKNTLKNTNLKRLKVNDPVNLEGAMKLGGRINGHIVTGHIDGERIIKRNYKGSNESRIDIGLLPGDKKYLIEKGSVAIDGVSLTVGKLSGSFFSIFLIPHTLDNSTLGKKRSGEHVNVEFDIIAKHVSEQAGKTGISQNILERNGFI
ncbi:MAG: riboflavin synthase [Candidatus Omnitrophota bacterium]